MHGISVILPCFNGARWIKSAIESVLAQTYREFELIIIDDGSTDDTRVVLTPYLHDKRVCYVYQINKGFTSAVNRGIKESRNDLIGFIGCDDLWMPNKLELQLKFLDQHRDVSLVHSCYYSVDSKGRVVALVRPRIPHSSSKRDIIKRLFLGNFIGWETVLVKRTCFDEVGFLDERMVAFSDHDIWLRVAGSFDFGYLDQPLVKKQQHELQLSRVKIEDNLKDEFLLVRKAMKRYPFLRRVVRKKLASLYYISGIALLNKGDKAKAKKQLAISVKYQPWRLRATIACITPTLYTLIADVVRRPHSRFIK